MFIITVCIEEENGDGNVIGKAVFVKTSEIKHLIKVILDYFTF